MSFRTRSRKKTAMEHILLGLIPYTEENLQLAFHPNKFFNELEKISGYKRKTLHQTLWRAKHRGLIESKKIPKLTLKGQKLIAPYRAKRLNKSVVLMIVFDIPEDQRVKRDELRSILRLWKFRQVQKSVWVSPLNYGKLLKKIVKEIEIEEYCEIFEAALV